MKNVLTRLAWQVAKLEMFFSSVIRKKKKKNGIVIVATTYMGDFVMTIPLIERVIKSGSQDVDIIVRESNFDLAKKITGVRSIYTVSKEYRSWSELKKLAGWNIGVLALDNKWVRLLKGVGCNQIIGFECREQKWNNLIDIKKHPSRGPKYLGDWIQELWEMDTNLKKFDSFVSNYAESIEIPSDKEDVDCVFVQMGASASSRTWSYEKYKKIVVWLIERGERVLIAGGPKERKAGVRLIEELGNEVNIRLLMEGCTKDEELRLLKYSKLYFGPDTGMTHMAKLLGVPTVSLMGPSQIEVFSYARKGSYDIYVPNLLCRDKEDLFAIDFGGVRTCGRQICQVEGWPCMQVEPDFVIEKIQSMLDG